MALLTPKSILLLMVALPLVGQKLPVTLETVASQTGSTGPGTITWAPDGTRFAFQNGKALHVYDVAKRTSRELVSLPAMEAAAEAVPKPARFGWENRRVRPQAIQWFPNGRELLVVAGGDLFRVKLEDGTWIQVTRTPVREDDPKLSPNGQAVSFLRGADLHVLTLAAKAERQLTQDGSETLWNGRPDWVYPEELDLGTAHWWSPDSRQVAYLQFDLSRERLYPHADLRGERAVAEPQRYPHAGTPNADVRLGVVAATGDDVRTRWMDLGETRDFLLARVQWTPDGASLAVQRMNRVQNRLDLLLAEAATGTARLLLRETDPHWVNIADDLHFLPSRAQFLWSSERGGYRHLYLYGTDGAMVRPLTEGPYEVTEMLGVDERQGWVYYQSSEGSPLERHLYRVSLDGKTKRRLSEREGTHSASLSAIGEHYVATFSSLTTPPRRTLHRADGTELAVLYETDQSALNKLDLLPTEIVPFKDADGRAFHGRLIRPPGFQAGRRYPAVVMVYGGPHSQAVRNAWPGVTWDQALAHRGFVIWQVDNRGSAGRGHAWETPLHRRLGRTELEDQQAGVRHLLSMGFVDPARLGLYGWSYGGFMTLYSLLHAPDLFRAGIAGAPVTDWTLYDTIYTERYLGLPQENREGYRASSPVHDAGQLKAALLLAHNIEDDNVVFQNTLRMMEALQQAGKPFDLQLYGQQAHGVTGPARRHMLEAMTRFLERELK